MEPGWARTRRGRSASLRRYAGAVLLVGLGAGTVPIFATTVVVIWTHDRIVVAADSLRAVITRNGARGPDSHVCKIGLRNGFVFAGTGNYGSQLMGYDVFDLMAESASRASSLDDMMARSTAKIMPAMRRALRQIQQWKPGYVRKEHDHLGFQFAAGVMRSDGQAIIARRSISVSASGGVSADIVSKAAPNPDQIASLIMGVTDALPEVKNDYPIRLAMSEGVPAETIATQLIEREVRACPDLVGPPIAILAVDKNGPRWIENGVCQ